MQRKRFQLGGLASSEEEDRGALGDFEEVWESVQTTTPEAREAARGILSQYMNTMKEGYAPEQELLDRMKDRAEEVRQALRRAREKIIQRRQPNAEILLSMAAGFGAPTRTGAFGETISNVASQMAPALQNRRAFDEARDQALLDIDTSMAGVDQNVMEAELSLAELRRRNEARLAEEALQTLGRRTSGSRSGTSARDREIARYYDQLLRLGMEPEAAWDRAVNLAYGRERMEVVDELGIVRGINEMTGGAWEVPLGDAEEVGLLLGQGPTRGAQGQPGGKTAQDFERDTPQDIRNELPEGTITLWDAALYGTGPWSALRAAYNIPAGWVGLPRARRTTLARQALRSETTDFIRSLIPNDRLPIGWVERIERDISLLPQILDEPDEMRDRMISIESTLRRRLEQAEADADNPNLPYDVRSAQDDNAAAIRRFLPVLGVPPMSQLGGVSRTQSRSQGQSPTQPQAAPQSEAEPDLLTAPPEDLPPEVREFWEEWTPEERQEILDAYGYGDQ